jgi:hypothetical protein
MEEASLVLCRWRDVRLIPHDSPCPTRMMLLARVSLGSLRDHLPVALKCYLRHDPEAPTTKELLGVPCLTRKVIAK